MEPYWHPVRGDQVIGRAVRICSHKDLEEEDRNVTIFKYIMKFSDVQIYGKPNSKIKDEQKPILDPEIIEHDIDQFGNHITTDQYLWNIERRKARINRDILNTIKSSAIDCSVHNDNEEYAEKLEYINQCIDD